MGYALSTIWFERQRFLPAILAVAFSAILIAVQGGLMIGLLSMMSLPIDKSTADVWVGYPGVRSVDLGRPIPERWVTRVASQPGVERVESALVGFSLWTRENPGSPPTTEVCTVVGSRLEPDSLAAVEDLRKNRELMASLAKPFTVAVDESEIGRLGIHRIGDKAQVFGRTVQVVGTVKGYRSLGGPYVFCSRDTARVLLRHEQSEVTYFVARCRSAEAAENVATRLNGNYLFAYTSDEFSQKSRLHWLTTTKAGIAIGFTALLGLLVGAVVTSQTLYAATAASQREYATLRAMGIPSWRLQLTVVIQSLWVGFFGLMVAIPLTLLLAEAASMAGTQVRLHPYVLTGATVVTMVMALGSGLAALRSFQGVDPAHNIR